MFISLAAHSKPTQPVTACTYAIVRQMMPYQLQLINNSVCNAARLILHTGHGKCFIQMNMSSMGHNATHVCSANTMYATEHIADVSASTMTSLNMTALIVNSQSIGPLLAPRTLHVNDDVDDDENRVFQTELTSNEDASVIDNVYNRVE